MPKWRKKELIEILDNSPNFDDFFKKFKSFSRKDLIIMILQKEIHKVLWQL
jgi:hypothetical protein